MADIAQDARHGQWRAGHADVYAHARVHIYIWRCNAASAASIIAAALPALECGAVDLLGMSVTLM